MICDGSELSGPRTRAKRASDVKAMGTVRSCFRIFVKQMNEINETVDEIDQLPALTIRVKEAH